jgi:hypothetical protein
MDREYKTPFFEHNADGTASRTLGSAQVKIFSGGQRATTGVSKTNEGSDFRFRAQHIPEFRSIDLFQIIRNFDLPGPRAFR